MLLKRQIEESSETGALGEAAKGETLALVYLQYILIARSCGH